MSVVYTIGSTFAGGGIGSIAYQATLGLHRHGLLARLLCGAYRQNALPHGLISALGLPDRGLRKLAAVTGSGRLLYLQSLLFDLWAARRLEPADLLHAWGNYGLRSIARAQQRGMIAVVQRASTHPLHQARLLAAEHARRGMGQRVLPAALRRALAEIEQADYVLIPSEFVRQTFHAAGVPDHKLITIPFGVDTRRFQPAPPAPRPFRALFVGQVSQRKGVEYLLEAWRLLGWRDAELWIAGRPAPSIRGLLARARQLPGVRLLGHTTNPIRVYQQADVFVFPSLEEGSALVTYEALACGLPLITTLNAGSVARAGVEALFVPIRDAEAIAAALERLRAHEGLRRQMGAAARQRAEAFTWEAHGDALAAAYAHLLER